MKSPTQHKVTIAVICVSIFIILLGVITTIVVAVVLGSRSPVSGSNFYYNGSFRILNLNYTDEYKQSNGTAFKLLSGQIENLLSAVFQDSQLKSDYRMSRVINLRSGSVIPEFVLLFNFNNTDNKSSSTDLVQRIFKDNLKNTSNTKFEIDQNSLKLSEISDLAAQNLLYAAPTIITVDPTVQTSPLNFTGCGVGGPTLSGKIVGGTAASPGAWPWQASLQVNGNHKCGASLISDSWLVAAAHCFSVFSNANQWTVVIGTIYSSSGPRLQVQEIIIHENYTILTHRNDIALLKLSVPLNFTKYVRPVCLPETSDVFPDNSSCYVTGWGALQEGGGPSSILQQAEVMIISTAQCSSAEMYGNKIGPSMICAGYVEGKVDSCQGDSGGPLVAKQSGGTWVLVGIVSFGYKCALPNKPGVYARVSYLRNWITNNSGL